MSRVGKVYLVGGGPGDPGLLTLKGKRCLEEADLVLYDGLVNPLLLRHTQATAERTSRADADGRRTLDQAEINQRLVEAGLAGKTVVRLKGGDPFIFGRGSEEAKALADAGVPYEVVPGITAATAAAEYAGISLTHREHASAVAFVTGHEDPDKSESALDYEQLAKFPGTLVFYMGLHRLPLISQALIDNGMSADAEVAVISRGSTPVQRTVTGSLREISELVKTAGLRPPSLIIVGSCVQLREEINWFERLPLAGLRIGITRPIDQVENAIELAHAHGAQPVLMPTIQIDPVSDWTKVDAAIQSLESYDWLTFTSVNGVDAFLHRIWELGFDSRKLSHLKIACIGPATAERLATYSLRADLVPEVYRGEELAKGLADHVAGKKVLWPRANRGREVLPEILTAAGAEFESLVVYEHQDVAQFEDSAKSALENREVDWIGLSSPTIARNIAKLLSDLNLSRPPQFAAISPVTEAAALEAGLQINAVATEHTWEGIFAAICNVQKN
ncbi:uroporphyrinogen-III C-methyltransferase [Planctomicrobium sp.]|jgi:uroporphyrinogen III methyltransferase / synthase|nr:uroporphyrinogen-III C-methyltransferase [Planctomicrobium sp.]MDB4743705.1 uroporphyrinogen-III C-methyltransferase [Planctomicrobium sp.]